jgi:hypothetical protein
LHALHRERRGDGGGQGVLPALQRLQAARRPAADGARHQAAVHDRRRDAARRPASLSGRPRATDARRRLHRWDLQRWLHGAACAATDAGNGIDAKGGISQVCCSNATSTPCFPTKTGSITRTGRPGTNGQTLVSAATFCIPRTGSTLINITGLPGPGALLLPAQVSVLP